MKSTTYIRLFFLVLAASISFLLFSYSRSNSAETPQPDCPDIEKCCQKKNQTDFMFFEALSRNLLSLNNR